MRGRRPTPIELKLLRGNPGRRKIPPYLRVMPPPEPPSPPEYLSEYGRAEWEKVAPQLCALRCLTALDLGALAAYCESVSRWRTAVESLNRMEAKDPLYRGLLVRDMSGNAAINPFVRIERKAAERMVRFAAELGMGPSARSRVAAGPHGRNDDWRA